MSVRCVLYILVGIPTSILTFPLCQQEDCCFYCKETTTKNILVIQTQSSLVGCTREMGFLWGWKDSIHKEVAESFKQFFMPVTLPNLFWQKFHSQMRPSVGLFKHQLQMKEVLLQKASENHFFQLCQGQAFPGLASTQMVKAILGRPSQEDSVPTSQINMLTKSLRH